MVTQRTADISKLIFDSFVLAPILLVLISFICEDRDLSNNKLNGSIPKDLGNLKSLGSL
jgi:hypothetical protein